MNKKLIYAVLLLLVCFSINAKAQHVSIIPRPDRVEALSGQKPFIITRNTAIVLGTSELEPSANFLNLIMQRNYGFKLPVRVGGKAANAIYLHKNNGSNAVKGAYDLSSSRKGITIGAAAPEGVFYGVQTLIQLLPSQRLSKVPVPAVYVNDRPRFEYRGALLDVGRYYLPVSFVKEFIDLIALHKMNVFHWHLTEDQGWRIEIKKYPKLTEIGAWRNGTITGRRPGTGNDGIRHGGFYTQDEIRDIVKYAAERYITIIPEIEMPGHASAAIASYPELSTFPGRNSYIDPKTAWTGSRIGKQVQQTWGIFDDIYTPSENTFTFLENVLDEVLELFPSKYIHIGGDEAPKKYWKESVFCQQLIKDKNLKDEHGLQSYFIQRMEKYLNSKGRQIIGWDEILEGGLAPNAIVMSWRGEKGGIEAIKQKHEVIMTPNTYFYLDYAQNAQEDSLVIGGYLPIQRVYSYEPVAKEITKEEEKYILGAQANLWSEYVSNPEKAKYLLLPRLDAVSEVLWTSKENKDYTDFKRRLPAQLQRYRFWNINYNKTWDNQPDKK